VTPNDTRRERLVARPMDETGIRAALDDARALRALGLPVLHSRGTTADTAAAVTAWLTRARP
jgi:hypothetical protein